MCKSETIGKLAAALAKAQKEIGGATMDKANPFFKSSYATLKSVINVVKGPCNDNGIAIVQGADGRDDKGNIIISTILMHESGEWIQMSMPIKPTKDDPQQLGSAVSYGRRYLLSAMLLVFQEDDDGNAASGKTQPKKQQKKAPAKKPDPAKAAEAAKKHSKDLDMEAAIVAMREAGRAAGVTSMEDALKIISTFLKRDVKSLKDLTVEDARYCTKQFKEG